MHNTQRLSAQLVNHRDAINRELARNGVRFGIYKDGEYDDRLYPYDPLPRIIASDEFDTLNAGLKQRVNALNSFLRDVYSDKAIITDGVIPEDYVYTTTGYLPQVNGITPPGGIFAHIAGEDLVQDQEGKWWVLEDNLRIPSGASYPLFVRDIERRIYPHLFRDVHIRDNREYPRLLRDAMNFVSTDGIAVVLTPGRYNSAFFEHSYLAEQTGAVLAFPEDLTVVDNKVYFTDYAGGLHRVGVVYRRLSDEYLDPFAFNPDSMIGVPGILNAYRAGNVSIINAPGNGVGDDKGIYYFVPEMIRYYLGEEPILNNAPTYLASVPKDLEYITKNFGDLVIKDVAEAGGYGVVFGRSLDAHDRQALIDHMTADPRRFIAQEIINFRDINVINPVTGEEQPRKCDLRVFVVTGRNTHVWYSGLTRYSSTPGEMIVNSSQGGGFKDTWILAPDDCVLYEQEPAAAFEKSLRQSNLHPLALVTSSKADNLFWLGRYTERVYTTLTRFFPFYDRVMDTNVDAFRPLADALDLPTDFQDFDAFVTSFLYDANDPNSVRFAVTAAFNNAVILRPELSSDLLQYIELALNSVVSAAEYANKAENLYRQRDVADAMLTFWGGVENSAVDPTLKSFILLGKYIERIDLYTRFRIPEDLLTAPMKKLATHANMLDGFPVPECLAEALRWLLAQLPARGYPSVSEALTAYLTDFSGRIKAKGLGTDSALGTDGAEYVI